MKKFVFFANYGSPYEGNFIASLKALEKRFNSNNIRITYVFPSRTKGREWIDLLKNSNNDIVLLPNSFFKSQIILSRILKDTDVVHTHFIDMKQMILLRVVRLFSKTNCKVIHHIHNHYESSANIIKRNLKKISLKNDLLLACGIGVYDSIKKAGLKNNLDFIDNGIDFKRLDKFNKYSLDKEKFNILMFGFDYKRKGVDLAIKSCHILVNKGFNIQLNISLSRNKEFVENEIKKMFSSIPSWISILSPRNDIATYYRNMDLFISPSREEGLCYSLIEAAYCDCLIVASNISGQNELSIDEIIWCQKENIDDLCSKIKYVMSLDDSTIKNMLDRQKKCVIDKYSIQRWVDDIENFYSKHHLL